MSWSRRAMKEEDEEVKSLDSFLPMGPLRVLLIEGDDSTRHIISALLKKCNYKVCAVSNGLKAWEILKEKPQGIDLVLTEVETPSISGLDLLTLIMSHETCKNIPVIMMSSQDSMAMVYKCMLKGAADFLVKPIRRNELVNLWQHVWRRQSLVDVHAGKSSHRDENLAKRKHEDMSEKEENISVVKKHKECSDKASEAESSCTRSFMEAESTYKQRNKEFNHEHQADSTNTPPKEAINLIDTIEKQTEIGCGTRNSQVSFSSSSMSFLDLSLRRYQHNGECTSTLNHSGSSAFTQYVHTTSTPVTHEWSDAARDTNINAKAIKCSPRRVMTSSLEPRDEQAHVSYVGESGSSSVCDVAHDRNNASTEVENGEKKTDDETRLSQREAALLKFRMKRKDRCFDKKVRYQSRKNLAEQRPRVKGQFVRRVQPEVPLTTA